MDYEFKDPLALARVVRIALMAWLLVSVCYGLSAAFSIVEIGRYQQGGATVQDLEIVDQVSRAVAIPMLLVNLVTIVLVARWIYRVNKNAHTLSHGMTMTPGWNIGFFFIPFANLWKPFEGIRQTWRASLSPSDPYEAPLPGWITLWWISWIVSTILNNASFRISLRANTLDQILLAEWLDAICTPVDLLAGILLLQLVARLSQIQHDANDAEAHQAVFE
ncbi:DUF4328 domain-containing protein [Sphingomonas sp. HITSZ_GF]|uniref:DUF4328 domain-containing protein n=1 Tax=Sphingomonas sp. HITSZ_GF TaxID=3037247 RepID=UPI00240E3DBF|nr:DUF4328 domain-containing protein [Sphingomonas sp. HITSZ_GF]MDG2533343.1 DUF4328 domain-containing protein [Sphingomonas sp. HITSZ_GF]